MIKEENRIHYLLGMVESININLENGVEFTQEQYKEYFRKTEELLLEAIGEEKYRP